LIGSLMLVWWNARWPLRLHLRGILETGLILGAVVGLSVVGFSSHQPLTYLVVPALILAAVYLGQRGATVGLVLAYAIAVAMTAANVGPFASASINDQTLRTQLYILVASLTTLILGAAVSARRAAAVELANARRREAERAAEERERIARDLHDSVSQTLFTLGLHVGIARHQTAAAKLPEGNELAATIEQVAELAHGALLEMRASIFELRRNAIAEQGVVAALRAHGAALEIQHDARVSVEGPSERLPLDVPVEELLFRIGQEAVTNAVKHSGSHAVSVEVEVERGKVALLVRDDGSGFDASCSYDGHLGLELMRSRAADAGGSVEIASGDGAGTTVRAVVPAIATATAPTHATFAAASRS
jgi:signal transduction histidine kinase